MEIEIITTKKKLSRSIISQMPQASLKSLKYGKPLGLLINVVKDCPEAILILFESEYYTLPMGYKKSKGATKSLVTTQTVYRITGRTKRIKQFLTPEVYNEWWEAYQEMCKRPLEHIYV